MKDYSFGDKEYQKSFILNYRFEDRPIVFNGRIPENILCRKIILYLANGTTMELENTFGNREAVIDKMVSQIERAYKELHQSTVDFSSQNIQKSFTNLKRYIAIKSKENDIEKNKLLLDNLAFINQALHMKNRDWMTGYNLPLYLQTVLIFNQEEETWDLNAADKYSLKELQQILNAARNSKYLSKEEQEKRVIK